MNQPLSVYRDEPPRSTRDSAIAGGPATDSDVGADGAFEIHLRAIIHAWLKTLTILGFTLMPFFFLLDVISLRPGHGHLLPWFAFYRFSTTAAILVQYWTIRKSKPGQRSHWHGYLFTFMVTLSISKMTTELGGFESGYYAGLILVTVAVNTFMPWRVVHSVINGVMTILVYVLMNLLTERPGKAEALVSNLFFLGGTVVIALSITHVKHKLARREFFLRLRLAASNEELGRSESALQKARDALWSEMEVAKRIQTSLLPQGEVLEGFDVAATMLPAEEVGGDYYDFIPTTTGGWIMIGDVSGHGVESGLIMMMAQMSVQSVVHDAPDVTPAKLLARINPVIKKNISRLGTARYMTASAILLRAGQMTISGMHQDVMIYRARSATTERVKTEGVWIGVLEDSAPYLSDIVVDLDEEDIVMLFTDGITEAANEDGEMFGEERLEALLQKYAALPVERIVDTILRTVATFQSTMQDDMTLVVARRRTNHLSNTPAPSLM